MVEAVYENLELKQEIFKKLDDVVKGDAILASNTSGLDIDAISSVTERPDKVVGTHFFSPANIMRLLEIVRGEKTSKETLATIMKLGKIIKKAAVMSLNAFKDITAAFFIIFPNFIIVARVSLDVFSPLTISNNLMILAGLKK